jgi:hypothetical protein
VRLTIHSLGSISADSLLVTEIAVSSADLAMIGKTSVQLKDGPDRYIAM